MYAYKEIYLGKAMRNIGNMFDFAINVFGIPGEDFAAMFASSEICRRIEQGEPKFLVGMCGEETALRVIEETTGIVPEADISGRYDRTPAYWCGRAVCYYQWLRMITYGDIFRICQYGEIDALYPALHEADISKFAGVMDERRSHLEVNTRLKRLRTACGYSQSELARESSVSLRSIQMYEQRRKDINKGQAAAIMNLARVLGCKCEDLLER